MKVFIHLFFFLCFLSLPVPQDHGRPQAVIFIGRSAGGLKDKINRQRPGFMASETQRK